MPEIAEDNWDLDHLRLHLQMAAFLEAWTIPYYMAAMFSIVDRATDAYQLIQSVLHQEMLHLQLAANVANAYGCSPHLEAGWFSYGHGEKIPYLHYEFSPSAALVAASAATPDDYQPRSAEIGRLDEARINTMCLIEFPHWSQGSTPAYRDDLTEYDSIGQFYDAVEHGLKQLGPAPIMGGRRQVDMFSAFYRRLPRVTVDSSGDEGLAQVLMLLNLIRDQGEAAKADDPIHRPNENTADDPHPECSHYNKFRTILAQPLPCTYADTVPVKDPGDYTDNDRCLEQILIGNFKNFIDALNGLFAGDNPEGFVPLMVTIGANILNCWKNNVTPKFTDTQQLSSFAMQQRNFYAL